MLKEMSTPTSTSEPRKATFSNLGGGGVKCAVCVKSVYPADPQISSDGHTWHKNTCFKCVNCSSQLSISNLAKIEGTLVCN